MRALTFVRPTRLVALLAASALLLGLPATRASAHVTSPHDMPTSRLVETTLRNMILLDMLWDPVHNQLYALAFAGSGEYSNSLIAIDPLTKTVVRQLPFASSPNNLDATDNFNTLVISLGNARKIVTVDVATFTVTQEIGAGTVSGQDAYPSDVDFMPGSSDTFAVTLSAADQFTRGVAIYKAGQRSPQMPVTAPGGALMALPEHIRFLSPTKLVGTTYHDLFEFNVNAAGVTFVDQTANAMTDPAQRDLVVDAAGVVWANSGSVFKATTNATVATLPTKGPFVLDPSRSRVYQATDSHLYARDKATRTTVGVYAFPGSERKQQMALFGDGFAVQADFDLILLTPPQCAGKEFTILGTSTTITGTSGNDVIYGTPGNDVINGLGGNDIICGADGNDTLVGGNGNDILDGGAGDDALQGSLGADDISGGAGFDAVKAGYTTEARSVTLDGIANDGVLGEGDNYRVGLEKILGSPGDDHLAGSDYFGEWLFGGGGNDTLDGRDGDDRLFGGPGADDVAGGDGIDTFTLTADDADHSVSLNDLADDGAASEGDNVHGTVEKVVGTPGRDTMRAGNGNVSFYGGAGDDQLFGGPANDYLDGGAGNDHVDGGEGFDGMLGGDGEDTCVADPVDADQTIGCETA